MHNPMMVSHRNRLKYSQEHRMKHSFKVSTHFLRTTFHAMKCTIYLSPLQMAKVRRTHGRRRADSRASAPTRRRIIDGLGVAIASVFKTSSTFPHSSICFTWRKYRASYCCGWACTRSSAARRSQAATCLHSSCSSFAASSEESWSICWSFHHC